MIQVVWFKRDLRTVDHRPLAEAAAAGPVIPLYVVEPEYWRLPDTSRRQWLVAHGALLQLAGRLSALGAPLIVRVGNVVEILAKIHASVGIARLLAHEETGNLWTFERDIAVHRFCRRHRRSRASNRNARRCPGCSFPGMASGTTAGSSKWVSPRSNSVNPFGRPLRLSSSTLH